MQEKIKFKDKFIERYSQLTDFEQFKETSLSFLRRSIRVNTLKMSVAELKKRLGDWKLDQVPWCKEGFWIKHATTDRRDIGNLAEHSLGYIYVQEAASMIPPVVLEPKPGEVVLDMCASPGSKATQIAQYMKNKGILVANDYRGMRIKPLGINMQRMGVSNTILTISEGRFFTKPVFDCILVDAPCSGTGTIRKSLKTLLLWNPNMIRRLAATQKQLIAAGFESLKPGRTMVYSTCSCEPEENEAVVSHLLEKYDNATIEKIKLNIKTSNPITEFENKIFDSRVKDCLRIWPQDNDTEGFFVAKIRKI